MQTGVMLATLLPELQERILNHCNVDDLRNLSLTNSKHNKALQWLLFRTLKIPSEDIALISQQVEMFTKHLYVSSKTSVTPDVTTRIKTFSNLFELNFNGNSGINDESIILLSEGSLTIKILDISCTDVVSLPGLAKLWTLEELYLTDTHVSDEGLVEVSGLAYLEKLDLQDNDTFTTAGFSRLVMLPELKYLGVSNCWHMESTAFKYIGQMSKLEVLLAFSCGLDDDSMVHLADLKLLRKLDVGFNDISDAGVAHIKGLRNLQKLCVCNCVRVTVGSVPYFQELKSLVKLNVRYCKVRDISGLCQIRKIMS